MCNVLSRHALRKQVVRWGRPGRTRREFRWLVLLSLVHRVAVSFSLVLSLSLGIVIIQSMDLPASRCVFAERPSFLCCCKFPFHRGGWSRINSAKNPEGPGEQTIEPRVLLFHPPRRVCVFCFPLKGLPVGGQRSCYGDSLFGEILCTLTRGRGGG